MLLTNLADVARRTGRPVTEVAGWRTRTTVPAGMTAVKTIVCHHTGSSGRGEMSTTLLVEGRPGLSGPLSQYGIGRSGTIYVIAAGRCSHAGVVLAPRFANEFAIGIEAMNDGLGEPWGDALMESYRLLCAELIAEFGLTVNDVLGHKEIASPPGRKIDPSFSMIAFRASIAGLEAQPPSPPAPTPPAHKEIDVFTCSDFGGTKWAVHPPTRSRIFDPAVAHAYNAAGTPDIGKVASNVLGAWAVALDPATARDQILAAITTAQAAGGTPEQIADAVVAEIAS